MRVLRDLLTWAAWFVSLPVFLLALFVTVLAIMVGAVFSSPCRPSDGEVTDAE